MIRLALLAVLAAISSLPAHSETFAVEDPRRWGTPESVVLPDYPSGALKAGRGGFVDVTGVVTALRAFKAEAFVPDSPASEDMAAAVREVLPHWQFYPPVGADCRPIIESTRFRVWFEVADGKPKISLSRGAGGGLARNKPKMLDATYKYDPRYPQSMLQQGLQAYVYAGMRLAPNGEVTEVITDVYPEENRVRLEDFAASTRRALGNWTFPAAANPSRMVCVEIFFRLRN